MLYPYYWPNYKAGGPTQSLFNLAAFFKDDAEFFVLSLNHEIDGSSVPIEVVNNAWNDGPNGERIFFVSKLSFGVVQSCIKSIKPHRIYINGLFNFGTTIPGVYAAKKAGIKFYIAPRGMLQAWALQRGFLKKIIYISWLKFWLGESVHWHATDQQEFEDIKKWFGDTQCVSIAANIPKQVYAKKVAQQKRADCIRLVFLSLINPNKNLHLVIDSVKNRESEFTLSIYGPVIDTNYWKACQEKIGHAKNITYEGPLPAWDVQDNLAQFDFFILPTQGENFGHAIFDALSSGVPVVTSHFTPWQNIENEKCGFYISELSADGMNAVMDEIMTLSSDEYEAMRTNATRYAEAYLAFRNFKKEYSFLLNQ